METPISSYQYLAMYAKIIQQPSSHLQIQIESPALAIGAASSIKAVRQDGS